MFLLLLQTPSYHLSRVIYSADNPDFFFPSSGEKETEREIVFFVIQCKSNGYFVQVDVVDLFQIYSTLFLQLGRNNTHVHCDWLREDRTVPRPLLRRSSPPSSQRPTTRSLESLGDYSSTVVSSLTKNSISSSSTSSVFNVSVSTSERRKQNKSYSNIQYTSQIPPTLHLFFFTHDSSTPFDDSSATATRQFACCGTR